MKPLKVVGIGSATLDFFGVMDRFPSPDGKADLSQFSLQGGGNAATALATVARLGLDASFCGKISDDFFGQYIRLGLEESGVNVDGLRVEPGRVSPFSFISLEAASDKRMVYQTPGSCSPLTHDEMDLGLLDGAAALILDGYHIQAGTKAAEYAHEKGIPVLLDASCLMEGMGEIFPLVSVLVAAERFSAEVAPRSSWQETMLELGRMGPEVVVITLGKEGSVGLMGKKMVHQGPLSVDVVDTSGAGDVFYGALTFAYLQEWSLEKMMQFASTAAGLSCRFLGGRLGIPKLEEIEKQAWP